MANRILEATPVARTAYRLPEAARRKIIGQSDLSQQITQIDAQRLRFMSAFGDAFGPTPQKNPKK